MIPGNQIRYLTNAMVDKLKWDRCIDNASNGLVYAYSFYLDGMSRNWDALVLNDYEAVMPLTWNKKYGFYYLYQPYYIPSLGVFGEYMPAITIKDFLHAIPKKFRYWDIDLNEANNLAGCKNDFHINTRSRTNHFLKLNKPYEEISAGYKRLCRRMIKRANSLQVEIVRDAKPLDVIEFYQKYYKAKQAGIPPGVYDKLTDSTTRCFENNMARIYLAKLPDGEITAAYLVLVYKKFIYSLIGGSSEKGKETGSFYLLTDAAIKDHAGSGKIFRFEGSDKPGIAFFDDQFGPEVVGYVHITRNALPFPFNLLKKGGRRPVIKIDS